MKLPKYITSEYPLMLGILVPYSLLLNFLIFSKALFSNATLFVATALITLTVKVIAWQLHTWIAMVMAKRYHKDSQTMHRIGISLVLFLPLTALVNTFIFWMYHQAGLYQFDLINFGIALLSGIGLNLLATFLHEGVANFEKWKLALTETEQLKTEYAKSRLEGLRTQVNPHFLFNSINTLSSLISEDPEKAEVFLDEMCKVYRYLLNSDRGEFVSLQKELQFIKSWSYILKVRYGSAIRFDLEVADSSLQKRIPPLTLQLLIEHIISRNMISKSQPLQIRIATSADNWLELYHTNALKIDAQEEDDHTNMHSVLNKFRLLDLAPVRITRQQEFQLIEIPLT